MPLSVALSGVSGLMTLDDTSSQVAPIHTLPNEIILSIFIHLRKHYEWTDIAMLRSTVVISHVCSRWREIALAASLLWTEIVYRARTTTDHSIAKQAYDRMETCLLRSRNQPLHVHFDLLDAGSKISPVDTFKAFVPPNLWRCSILEIYIPDHAMASAIFSLPCDLSRVKSFALATIYAIDSDGRDDDPRKQPIKIGSTSNTSFSPSRFRVNSALALTFPDFDGSNLDTLYVADEYLGHPEILRLLSRSANAQRMHLQVRDPRSLFPHPLTFPRLLFLSTLSKWPTQRFHAPSLRKLVITRPWLMRDSQAWLGLSAGLPHLQHLTLYDVDKSCYVSKVELLFSMMTHIPQLFTLELKQWFVRWLLQFAVASPITPASTADTEWLAPLKTSLSANNPASGSNDYNRHQSNLDPTLPGPTMFLPNLQLLILSSSEDKADGDALFRDDLDTGLQNILRARPTLSLHYNGSFMTGSNGSIEEAQALLRESMELGHMHQSDRREHGRIYSGLQNDIVV